MHSGQDHEGQPGDRNRQRQPFVKTPLAWVNQARLFLDPIECSSAYQRDGHFGSCLIHGLLPDDFCET
jgi:hypothetical protein